MVFSFTARAFERPKRKAASPISLGEESDVPPRDKQQRFTPPARERAKRKPRQSRIARRGLRTLNVPARPIDSRWPNQVSHRQVFRLPGRELSNAMLRFEDSTFHRPFPSPLRTGTVASCGGRHRLQRRVRGRFSRPSLLVPIHHGTPATSDTIEAPLSPCQSSTREFPIFFRAVRAPVSSESNCGGIALGRPRGGELRSLLVTWLRTVLRSRRR